MQKLCLVILLLLTQLAHADTLEVKNGQELAIRSQSGPLTLKSAGRSSRPVGRVASASASSIGAIQSLAAGTRRRVERKLLEDACKPYLQQGFACEPNVVFHSTATVPDDASYSRQWGPEYIHLDQAWDLGRGSRTVIAAVVDTGVAYTHPDLSDNIVINSGEIAGNGRDDDGNGYVDDVYGYDFVSKDPEPFDQNDHGTHVSGIIGATGNNTRGVCGVNWEVGLLAVRVLDETGSGLLSDVVSGIDYAVARGANIVNLSLGAPSGSSLLQQSIVAARDAGVLVVVAAGNDGTDNGETPTYPASYRYSNLLSVAAVDSDGALAYYSNFGATTVDVAAPGSSILSTIIPTSEGSYGYMSGTSMAAPHVTGLAALLKSINPSLSMLTIRDLLITSSRPLADLSGRVISNGIVDAYQAAIQAAANYAAQPAPSLSLRVRRQTKTTAMLTGGVLDSLSGTAVPAHQVSLYCNGKRLSRKTSRSDGSVVFSTVKKLTRVQRCSARDGLSASRTIKIAKRQR